MDRHNAVFNSAFTSALIPVPADLQSLSSDELLRTLFPAQPIPVRAIPVQPVPVRTPHAETLKNLLRVHLPALLQGLLRGVPDAVGVMQRLAEADTQDALDDAMNDLSITLSDLSLTSAQAVSSDLDLTGLLCRALNLHLQSPQQADALALYLSTPWLLLLPHSYLATSKHDLYRLANKTELLQRLQNDGYVNNRNADELLAVRSTRALYRLISSLPYDPDLLTSDRGLLTLKNAEALRQDGLEIPLCLPLQQRFRLRTQDYRTLCSAFAPGQLRALLHRLKAQPKPADDSGVLQGLCNEIQALRDHPKLPELLKNAGDLNRLHTTLTMMLREIKFPKLSIESARNPALACLDVTLELRLSGVPLQFTRVQDTSELWQIGHDMHHCVGSYRESVLAGRTVIVVGRDGKGRALACLEFMVTRNDKLNENGQHRYTPDAPLLDFRTDELTLTQYKLPSNGRPKDAALQAALAYLSGTGIPTRQLTCSDLKGAKLLPPRQVIRADEAELQTALNHDHTRPVALNHAV